MNLLLRISNWIAGHIACVILVISLIALFVPASFAWVSPSAINPLLGVVMFGMGLTLRPIDFKVVFSRPQDVLVGSLAQFTIMPLVAWFLCHLFHLPQDIAIGVMLVGCCPGGTASNVITYLAKGDVALSVGMTGVSTLLAPIVTPLLILLLAGETIQVNLWGMFQSIIQVVILPIVLGFFLNYHCKKYTAKIIPFLPMISTLTIALIIACIISINAAQIIQCSFLLWGVVVLHNFLGLILGYAVGKCMKMNTAKRSAIAIEVGMQNSGLATSLAATHFAIYPMAAIPGAIFSVWHNFSGSFAAAYFKRR